MDLLLLRWDTEMGNVQQPEAVRPGYAECPFPDTYFCAALPSSMSDLGSFVKALTSRYRGRLRYYELMNEPWAVGKGIESGEVAPSGRITFFRSFTVTILRQKSLHQTFIFQETVLPMSRLISKQAGQGMLIF